MGDNLCVQNMQANVVNPNGLAEIIAICAWVPENITGDVEFSPGIFPIRLNKL